MPRLKKRTSPFKALLPICISAVAIYIITRHDPALLGWSTAWPELVKPLLRTFSYLGVGLATGILVEGMGWAPLLARAVRPLMRFGNLKDESGAAFTTAFISGTTANSMLMSFWQDGKLTEKEMRLSYLVNTGLPVFLLHLPTTFFIVVPITGKAGVIYLTLNGVAALCRTMVVLGWTRAWLPRCAPDTTLTGGNTHTAGISTRRNKQQDSSHRHSGFSMEKTVSLFRRRFTRIITITAPVYFLIYALTQAGLFEAMRQLTAKWVASSLLPVEAASVVIFAVASEFTSGIAAAGALLAAGTLSTQQTVLALILGTIAATPIRAIRHQLPSHAGIFTPALGLAMLLQSQALRIGSLVLVTGVWLLLQ